MFRLKYKMIVVGSVIIAVTALLFSVFLMTAVRGDMESDIVRESRIFAKANSRDILQDYLDYYSNPAVGIYGRFSDSLGMKLEGAPEIREVTLIGVNGRILFDSSEIALGRHSGPDRMVEDPEILSLVRRLVTSERTVWRDSLRFTEIYEPVTEVSGGHIVTVRYLVSYESLNRRIWGLFSKGIMAFGFSAAFAAALLVFFASSVTAPVAELNRLVSGARDGVFSGRAEIRSSDEIGELSASFNRMADELDAARRRAESYSRDLEEQVRSRTEELSARNSDLERANRNLARMNRLMVDRELKMAELKRQLSAREGGR